MRYLRKSRIEMFFVSMWNYSEVKENETEDRDVKNKNDAYKSNIFKQSLLFCALKKYSLYGHEEEMKSSIVA